MNFFQVGDSVFNIALVVQIQKIGLDNYTVFLSDSRSFPGLTKNQVNTILSIIGINL